MDLGPHLDPMDPDPGPHLDPINTIPVLSLEQTNPDSIPKPQPALSFAWTRRTLTSALAWIRTTTILASTWTRPTPPRRLTLKPSLALAWTRRLILLGPAPNLDKTDPGPHGTQPSQLPSPKPVPFPPRD